MQQILTEILTDLHNKSLKYKCFEVNFEKHTLKTV